MQRTILVYFENLFKAKTKRFMFYLIAIGMEILFLFIFYPCQFPYFPYIACTLNQCALNQTITRVQMQSRTLIVYQTYYDRCIEYKLNM